eukprot:2311810-Alexandrium_andersonii.AAC.1
MSRASTMFAGLQGQSWMVAPRNRPRRPRVNLAERAKKDLSADRRRQTPEPYIVQIWAPEVPPVL